MKQFLAVLSLFCLAMREASAFGGSSPEAAIKIENTSGEMTESAFNFEDDGQDQESGGRAIDFSSVKKGSADGFTAHKDNFNCPKGQRISHSMECSQAVAALGYSNKVTSGLYTNIPFGCILYGDSPIFNYYKDGPSPGPAGYGLKSVCADTEKCAFPSCKSDGTYGPGDLYRVGDNDYYLAGSYGTMCPAGQFLETVDECKEAAKGIPLAEWVLREGGEIGIDEPVDDYMQGCYLNPVRLFFNDHVVTPGNKHAPHMINICKKPVIPCWKKYNRKAHQCLPKGYAHEDKKNYQWDGKAIEDCRKECAQNSECVGIQFLWANGKGKKKTDSRCYHILQGDCPAIGTWDTAWSKGKGKWGVETVGCWDANFDIL